MARHSTTPLSIERLEDRRLLAANAILNAGNGNLQVTGTNQGEIITIDAETSYVFVNVSNPLAVPSASNVPRSGLTSGLAPVAKPIQFRFRLSDVKTIDVQANDGDDTIKNNTSIPMTANGGWGKDFIRGGSGKDTLIGSYDNDTLEGGGDNDTLHGRSGNDTLSGNAGNDTLWGDQDVDTLYGGANDDVLHGGVGNDFLYGDEGNDKLWGDEGVDTVDGGFGYDRILAFQESPTPPLTDNWVQSGAHVPDALIVFENGGLLNDVSIGYAEPVDYSAGAFQSSEMEVVDKALDILFSRTHNNTLLKQADGGALTFVRQGEALYTQAQLGQRAVNDILGIHNPTFYAWNNNVTDRITLLDIMFDAGDDSAMGSVIHEIGHNWDDIAENPFVVPFRGLSGWVETNPKSWDFTQAGSGAHPWWHLTQAKFVSEYAKTNPWEDFAESFEAYFMNAPAATPVIPGKLAVLDAFFNSLMS